MKVMVDKQKVRYQLQEIERMNPCKQINLMEVCGTHTHAIGKSGLRQLLPQNINLISGPGCPVCVTDDWEIESYLDLARQGRVIIATFGDLLKVPGTRGSLADARGDGIRVSVVYSPLEALTLAQNNPTAEVVFLGAGFETTTPVVAMSVLEAKERGLKNYSVFSMHKLVPPALAALLEDKEVNVDGFILPGHVSTIIGQEPYQFLSRDYGKGGVIAGFEPEDILETVGMLLAQMNQGEPAIKIQYHRGMAPEGNAVAREAAAKVFTPEDARWRGLGLLPESGLRLRREYERFDAKAKFGLPQVPPTAVKVQPGCACGEILKGIKKPHQCRSFGRACTPMEPVGPCMVSSEGTCAAYYRYAEYQGELA